MKSFNSFWMSNMHKDIVRFTEEGVFKSDSEIFQKRCFFEKLLEEKMRDQGYVPILDLSSDWSTYYDAELDQYSFVISLYGVESNSNACLVYSNGRYIKIK